MGEQSASNKMNCPSCGSPLILPAAGSKTVHCDFCGTSTIIPQQAQTLPGASEQLNARKTEVLNKILQQLAAGNKIEAIKIYRQNYEVGLAEAKKAVEVLEANGSMDLPDPIGNPEVLDDSALAGRKAKIMNAILLQLSAGNKIEAIKIYRLNFDSSLTEAKRAVEEIQAHGNMNLPDPVGERLGGQFEATLAAQKEPYRRDQSVNNQQKGLKGCGLGIGLLFGLVVVLIIAAVVIIPMLANGKSAALLPEFIAPMAQTLRGKPTMLDPVTWIQADSTSPDIVVQARRFNTDPYTTGLARVSPSAGKIVWESAPFVGEDTTVDKLYSDGAQIYAITKNIVQAYRADNGEMVWQVKLTDKSGYCAPLETCIYSQNKVLLILTADENVQALNTADGTLLWQHRVEYGNNGLYRFKNWVVIYAKDKAASGNYVSFLNVDSGLEEYKVSPKDFYGGPKIYFDEKSMYFLDRRIEKWDLSGETPQLAWSQENDQSIDDEGVVQGADMLFAKANHSLYAIDAADGSKRALIYNEDYEYSPLSVKENQVLILAKRNRGTQVSALWVVDQKSGEQVGPIDFGEGKIIQDTYERVYSGDQYIWTYLFSGNSLTTVKFLSDPNQIRIESYNLASGEKLKTETLPFTQISKGDYSLNRMIGWQKNVLWVMAENHILAVDVEKGKMLFWY